jgi:hypothetical protein
MGEALLLRRNSSSNPGVTVPRVQNCNSPCKINEPAAFNVPKFRVLGMVNEKVSHHGNASGRRREPTLMPLGIGGLGF